ncbi:MAG: hypothetical protein SFV18_19630 [Bryobacteraceae bacterium]|nr:hypothetical protein [Bryobacteraceae bacterium]
MKVPTAKEFEIYRRVKNYVDDKAALRRYGYLSPGDSVFARGDAEVVIGGPDEVFDDVVKYEEGYYQAARELFEWASDRIEKAWTVYPILFVSRHAVELSLKKLIVNVFDPPPKKVSNEHDLKALWEMLLNRLKEQYSFAVPRNADLITKIISELTEIDPKSMTSRYATEKDFKAASIANKKYLSLRNMQAIVAKLYNELYSIAHILDEHRLIPELNKSS